MFRRRLLLNRPKKKPAAEYIKDGLVFHLDGYNKGKDTSAWTDLIGGKKLVYTNCILQEDGVKFDGTAYMSYDKHDIIADAENSTIEVCAYYDQINADINLITPNENSLGISMYGTRIWYNNTKKSAFFNVKRYQKNLMAITPNYCINNGKIITSAPDQYGLGKTDKFYVGDRPDKPGRPMRGVIYSVRIYNRILTEEEILYNQQVDIDRFFGGVAPV